MGLNKTELMPFKKFVQYHLKKLFNEKRKRINGTFKDLKTNEIVHKDIFEANIIGSGDAKETYKAYVEWYNYTMEEYENKRKFINAKWEKTS